MQLPTYEDMLLPLCTDTRISEWVPLGNTRGLIAGTKPCRLSGTSLSLDLTSLVLRWSKNFISLLLNVWPPPPKKKLFLFCRHNREASTSSLKMGETLDLRYINRRPVHTLDPLPPKYGTSRPHLLYWFCGDLHCIPPWVFHFYQWMFVYLRHLLRQSAIIESMTFPWSCYDGESIDMFYRVVILQTLASWQGLSLMLY